MQFTEIEGYIGRAKKIRDPGHIKYKLWFDENNGLYVQMEKNEGDGSFSKLAFSVAKSAPIRHSTKIEKGLVGYDVITGIEERIADGGGEDNNNGAFLKAVLKNLCSCKDISDDLLSLLLSKLAT